MPAMSVADMRLNAEQVLIEAEAKLTALRAEKVNIQNAIKVTVGERDEAKRIVSKLAPPKLRNVEAVDADAETEVLLADAEAS
jgi:hypothetical protein